MPDSDMHIYSQYILALRLLPVLPQDSRVAMEDTILPTGGGPEGKSRILVPSGTMVSFSIMALHRRKDLWGEDAEEFLPERWEGLQPGWVSISGSLKKSRDLITLAEVYPLLARTSHLLGS
jgi:cytochrome P450